MNNGKSVALIVVVILGWAGIVYAQSPVTPPGTGTQADPYLISELGHLVWMGDNVDDSSGKYYTMTANIDASTTATWNDVGTDVTILEGFRPIGWYLDPLMPQFPFAGIFDGNGHTINGLTINRTADINDNNVGLFGRVITGGQVKNLGLIGNAVTGRSQVGGLVGLSGGTVTNCYFTGVVSGSGSVGGLVGYNTGTMANCYAVGATSGSQYVGGLVGYSTFGTISNCHASGEVTSTGAESGGLIGHHQWGAVTNCYATATVTGTSSVGGLVGQNNAGSRAATLTNCYATGAVTGSSDYLGGLVGYNNGTTASMTNCYATGAVTGTGSYVGGLVGGNSAGTVSNSYWDTQTSGRSTSAGGTGKTTAEMKQQATFVGWDFTNTWGICENTTYPFLRSLSLDSDGDGLFDVCDACPSTPIGEAVNAQGCACSQILNCVTPPGTGTQADPYLISEPGHLVWMGEKVGDSSGKYYIMTADIDASATATWNDEGTDTSTLEGFKPIGTYSSPDTTSFRGIFDGNGYTISGLTINRPSTNYAGLFGYVGTGGQVKNLGLVSGSVMGRQYVGGLVGENNGTVLNGYASGAVTGTSSYIGDLVGYNHLGTVSNSYATGAVDGSHNVGGLVGYNSGSGAVSDCYATGMVKGRNAVVGGLIGLNEGGTISNCYATGAVEGIGSVGGLLGYNGGSSSGGAVSNCYATGAISGDYNIGGLIGENRGTVSNGYATSAVSGSYAVGGLVGYSVGGAVTDCYANGMVTGASRAGGLVGAKTGSTVTNCYWDMQTSGQSTSAGGTAKTTAQMKQQATFVSWDFATTWGLNENIFYPRFQNMDSDKDGIFDFSDNCPNAANLDQADADGDYVGDACDQCPDTLGGDLVNLQGCACNQISSCDDSNLCTLDTCYAGVCLHTIQDTDHDGVCDANDQCPDTPIFELVNTQGCACSQISCDDSNPCTVDICIAGVCGSHTPYAKGDANRSGAIDADDVVDFVNALLSGTDNGCGTANVDGDAEGKVNGLDIQAFVELLF